MRTYDPDIEAQLDAGRIDRRDAVLFVLDEGAFGFVSGVVGTLPWNSVDYVGSGSLLGIEMGESDMAQTNSGIEVTLSSHYEVDGVRTELFDTGLLQSIEQMSWFRRPAIVGRFWIAESGTIIDFEQRARCEIHQIVHQEDDEKGYTIRGILENVNVFRTLVDAKTRNSQFQALIAPGDTGLDGLSVVATDKIYWGRRPPEAA